MSDERAATNFEVGDSAPASPTSHEASVHDPEPHSPVTIRHRTQARHLRRLVNRVDATHWFTSVSADTRAQALLSLCVGNEWIDPDRLEWVFGDPLDCGGDEEDCRVESVTLDVCDDVLSEQPAPVHNVLNAPFHPGVLNEMTGNWFADSLLSDGHETSAAEEITNFMRTMDHAMHRYGVQLSDREARSVTRSLIIRFMMIFSIAYQVPVTDAYSTFGKDGAEPVEGFTRTLMLLAVDARFYIEASWQAIMHYAQLTWTCRYELVPMTDHQILQACKVAELPDYLCNDFDNQQYSSYARGTPKGYNVPTQHCGYIYEESMWRKYVAAVLCVLLAVSIMILVTALTVRSLRLAAKITGAVVHFLSELAYTISSYFEFMKNRKALRVARVTVGGEVATPLFKLINAASSSIDSLEMSVKGSDIRTSGVIPGCVYLALVHDGSVTYIGMGFRHCDYLVTAQHNIFAMTSLPGKYYLIPFRPDRKAEICELDEGRMLELTPMMIEKDIVADNYPGYDVSIIPIGLAQWSQLAVKSLDHTDAIWNSNVTVYGLEKSANKKLQRSLGGIVKHEDAALTDVFYTASTLKGWSGSPVLSGQKKVVALHCGTNGELNRGLNFAYVRLFITLHETSLLEDSENAKDFQISRTFRGRTGRLARRREELELEAREDAAHERVKLTTCQGSNGQIWFSSTTDVQNVENFHFPPAREMRWEDESATIPPPPHTQKTPVPLRIDVPAAISPRRDQLFAFAKGSPFVVERNGVYTSAPHFKGKPEDSERNVDLAKAEELGYTPGAFGMPRATDRESAISRSKHSLSTSLEGSVDVRLNSEIPSTVLRATVKSLLVKVLAPCRYVSDCNGVTRDKIVSQLHSSAVGSSKSPGLPYTLEGYTTNACLLESLSVDEVAQQAVRKYRDGTWEQPSVIFMKLEPTKVEKLDKGLDRNVQAVGLDAQLYFRCHFSGLSEAATANYRKSPIMCGWSPLKPGDGQFLYSEMSKKNKKILEYDGIAFEFTAHTEESYLDVTDVIVALAVPAPGVSAQQMSDWRSEAREFMRKMGMSGFQFPDGTLIRKLVPMVLNSGRWDTFIRNSITVLYWFFTALLEMGYTVNEIERLFVPKAGGDDIVGLVPSDFNTDLFTAAMRKYGMKIHKLKLKDIKEGFDFFSWHFSENAMGKVQWQPTRFSKHIENFLISQHDVRPEALVAHMMNWVHSEPHYAFFRDVYVRSRAENPVAYPLEKLPDRASLLLHLEGLESLITESERVERFVGLALKSLN